MAIGTPRTLYSGTSASHYGSSPTLTVTLTDGAAVGDRVWLFQAVEAGDTAPEVPAMSVTDSKGNAWTFFQPMLRNGVTGGTVAIIGASAPVTTALVAGDTVTIANTDGLWGTNRHATAIAAASGVDTLDQSAVYTGGSSSSPALGPTAATDTASEIVWEFYGSGVQAFTPSAGFTELAELATAGASANRQLSVAYKIVSATGTQSAQPTFAASTTVVGSLSTWRDASPATYTHYLFNGTDWVPADVTLL